ncbi:MAG TPA: InlB B-repeat-containing protein [Candidatus Olsenella excrementavium]|uniref:InlB B-repeat-containing protein n=1 Tax=Candidatus Olsenella excrementavium TaxID=2838709 RepID=A0A9D1ZBE5_9ACTN|nr:InlB B-repeat-containing protein [Candidatus Olsenella excrementavium]
MTRTSSPRPRARPPPAAETEEAEEVETPKATTISVEPQLLSTTSAQPTNASTRAGGSYTIKIDESTTLRGGSDGLFPDHSWEGYDSSIIQVRGNGSSATVTGLAEGTTTITHTWEWGVWPFEQRKSETFTITVRGVNVYFYTLIPNIEFNPDAAADTQWNGMGIGTVYGIEAPSNYRIEEIVYKGDDLNSLLNNSENIFPDNPDITVGDTKYVYAAPGSPEAMQADHYTIEWTRLKVASGANAGANGVNTPTVPEGTPTYHLDGRVTLIDEDKIQVGFQVKQPNATEFDDPIAKYYLLYDKNVAYSEINVPGNEDVPPYKDVEGVQYYFDGWYTDEACAQKANFESGGTLSENTTFYGRYVPANDCLTYDANGGSGDSYTSQGNAATDFEVKVLDNRFTAPKGKVFDSWNTKADGTGETIQPGDTYTLDPDANDVLYAQWKDNLSSFTVTDGEWYYDGTMHGVTVSGVKKGDTLTFKLINDEGKTVYESEEIVDSDTGTYTSACGAKDVADSGTMSVTLTRGSTTSEPKTADLTINRRQITFTSATLSKTYDGTDEFKKNGVTVSSNLHPDKGGGWANGEGAGYTLTATCPVNVGSAVSNTFDVVPYNGTDLNNYEINKVVGTLTVTKATITVTAEDQTKVEGERDPQLTTTYSGAKNGETPGWTGSVTREAGETPNDYRIMQGTLELADNPDGKFMASNYNLAFNEGTLTITAADDDDDDTPVNPGGQDDDDEPGDDNPGGGGDDTNPGGGGTTTGGGTNPVPVAVTAGDDADDTDDAEDEETVEEDETPLTDDTESDSEQIGDDTTPLASGETNEQTCWTHWVMLAGLGVTVVYFALSAVRTRRATNELASFEDDVLGGR